MKLKIFNIFFALIFFIAQPISISNAVLANEELREQINLNFRITITDTIIICHRNMDENCHTSMYLPGGKRVSYKELLSKNPKMEICYLPNYKTVFSVKSFQKQNVKKHLNIHYHIKNQLIKTAIKFLKTQRF